MSFDVLEFVCFAGETLNYRIKYALADGEKPAYAMLDVGSVTVFTVNRLQLGACYLFNVMARNKLGSSSYMRNELKSCCLSEFRFALLPSTIFVQNR